MVAYYGCRIGGGGEFILCGKKGHYIALGWSKVGDLSSIDSSNLREEVNKQYKKGYPGDSKQQRAKTVGQIATFIQKIKNGDYVFVPNPVSRTILIGKVVGGYYYQKRRDDCPYKHRRKVKWINEIRRDDFSQKLKYSLGSLLTVFQLKGHDSEVDALIRGKKLAAIQRSYLNKEAEESVVGETINFRGLVYAPTNEQGVVFLFAKVSKDLGIDVEEIKTGFPDAIGRVKTKRGYARRTIEFEFRSSNYDHLPDKSDIIVCWEHDWSECPKEIEVIELKAVVKQLKNHEVEGE